MALRIDPDTIRLEVKQIMAILNKWDKRMEDGFPGDEIPSNAENEEIFQMKLRGELHLAAERLLALVEVTE